jgi:hypothetical protein
LIDGDLIRIGRTSLQISILESEAAFWLVTSHNVGAPHTPDGS